MFQCPGCLDYINIVIHSPNRVPVPYEIEGGAVHKCQELIDLQKWLDEIAAAELEEFLIESDDPEPILKEVQDRSLEES